MIAAARTAHGVYLVDVDADEPLGLSDEPFPEVAPPDVTLPLLVAAARSGETLVAVVRRRPPLVVSYDAGRTWDEAGGGLPPGRAVAIADHDPELVLFAGRNRLYLSRDGARFWQVLAPELPEIDAVALIPG